MVHTMTSGNSSETRPKRWQNALLVIAVSAISIGLADRIFITYEQNNLVPRLPDINDTAPVNLAALRYNDRVVRRDSPPGEFRILNFGDSFAYSVVEPVHSYSGVIQERLQATIPDSRFRVINLGEPATGTRHFREAHVYWSQIFEHDAVLFHIFLGNDILDDAYLHASMDWAPNAAVLTSDNPILKAGNRRIPRKFPLRMMDYAYAWLMSSRSRSGEALPEGYNWAALTSFDDKTFEAINFKFMENFDPEKMDTLLAGYEQVYLLLKRAREIYDSGIPVAIALGPSQPQIDDSIRDAALLANEVDGSHYDLSLANRIIKQLHAQVAPDVLLIDLTESFRSYHRETGEKLYFRQNTHWDMEGNRLAGDLISDQLLETWFGYDSVVTVSTEHAEQEALVSNSDIEDYLAPLIGGSDIGHPQISGAIRAVQMVDGIIGQPDNWAIASFDQPVLLEFAQPRNLAAIRLHLFNADGRKYRFTVEAQANGEWQTVSDHSKTAVGGVQEFILPQKPISLIRITGYYNSAQELNPANAYLHIEEIELIE